MGERIQNVAVVGASGRLGPTVVHALLTAGFHVTALTRSSSTAALDLPGEVAVARADYTSLESLRDALRGQDAVVSVVSSELAATRSQILIIEAAVAAGVRRFLPSEFGVNSQTLGDSPMANLRGEKAVVIEHLRMRAEKNPGFAWTGLRTGQFFDWSFRIGASGIDLQARTARVVDSGVEKYQASNFSHIARGVIAILQRPDVTADKYLSTASFNVSQNDIIRIVEKLTGFRLKRIAVDSAALQSAGKEKLASGDLTGAWMDLVTPYYRADGADRCLRDEDNANDLLRLEESLEQTVREWLLGAGVTLVGENHLG